LRLDLKCTKENKSSVSEYCIWQHVYKDDLNSATNLLIHSWWNQNLLLGIVAIVCNDFVSHNPSVRHLCLFPFPYGVFRSQWARKSSIQ